MIDDKEFHEAWDRIARTSDGRTVYLHLQKHLMGVAVGASDGTLRENNGERKFAAQLIGLMAKGILESGGRSDPIYAFASAEPRAVARVRGAGRRISADTFVAGYDTPDAKPDTERSGT